MDKMIQEYEMARKKLEQRVHELTEALKRPGLRTREREVLELRREVLMEERVDLLHGIREMKEHLQGEEDADGRKNRSADQRYSDKRRTRTGAGQRRTARRGKAGAAGCAVQ